MVTDEPGVTLKSDGTTLFTSSQNVTSELPVIVMPRVAKPVLFGTSPNTLVRPLEKAMFPLLVSRGAGRREWRDD